MFTLDDNTVKSINFINSDNLIDDEFYLEFEMQGKVNVIHCVHTTSRCIWNRRGHLIDGKPSQ
mgnify:FL=1